MTAPTELDRDRKNGIYLLRRRDQQFIAVVLVVAGLAIVGWNREREGTDRLIEWDQMRARTARFEVDVNTAAWPELTQLPEIGETLARRIVENRETEGPFRSPDDLTRVHGIGEKTVVRMRSYLCSASWPREDASVDGTSAQEHPQ